MGSYAELVRIHAALDIDDGWESCRHDIVRGAKRPRVTCLALSHVTVWLIERDSKGAELGVAPHASVLHRSGDD